MTEVLPQDDETIDRKAIEMEYIALREEILQRIELRQQLLSLTLGFAGVFLGFGFQISPRIALIYPPLAALLALAWGQNDYHIWVLSEYIKKNIEYKIPNLHWHDFMNQIQGRSPFNILSHLRLSKCWLLLTVSHGGAFLLTQFMAIGIGIMNANITFKFVDIILLIVDVIALLAVIQILRALLGERIRLPSYGE
jgi:hypothetical protein